MRKIYYLLIFIFSFSVLSAQEKLTKEEKARREKNIQAGNPFAKYGYKAKVATLSKGKYLEFHDLDSIVTIGTSRWHVDNKKIVGDIVIDSLNIDAQPIGDAPGMWMSPDPLSEEFPSYSPYNFCFDNPLKFKDPDGRAANDIIVDGNGNKMDISISNNNNIIIYGSNVPQDVQNTLNGMWKTEEGQQQVNHLLNTNSKIQMSVSENIGVYFYEGKYYACYGLTGPTPNQNDKLIKDYDGGKVFTENNITLFKGTLEYGLNGKFNQDKVTVIDPISGKDISKDHIGKVKLEPSQHPDLIYKNDLEFYNLGGTHETFHTNSSNIALKVKGKDAEGPAYQGEARSREQLNKKQ